MLASNKDILSIISNKKYPLRLDNFLTAKRTFLQLYRQSMYQLYIMGYQSDPHRFSEKEARTSLVESGYDITNAAGTLELSTDNLLITLAKEMYSEGKTLFNHGDGLFISVFDSRFWSGMMSGYRPVSGIKAVFLTLLLRDQLQYLDKLYDISQINKVLINHINKKTFVYDCSYYFSSYYTPIFTESVHMALTGKMQSIDSYNIYNGVWDALIEQGYGLPEIPTLEKATADWVESDNYIIDKPTPGVLVDGISYIDEQVILPVLLTGRYLMNTDLGLKVSETINNVLSDNKKKSLIASLRSENPSKFQDMAFKSLQSNVKDMVVEDIIYLDSTTCYTGADTGMLPIVFNNLGYDVHGNHFEFKEVLAGLSGELLNSTHFTNDDGTPYQFKGVPLTTSLQDSSGEYYDLELAILYGDVEDSYTTLFKDNFFRIQYGKEIDSEILDMYEPENLASAILLAYNSAESGFFGPVFYDESLSVLIEETVDSFLTN